MNKLDNKKGAANRIIALLLLVAIVLPILFTPVNADGFGEGEGEDPTLVSWGTWHNLEGPNAWNEFKAIQSPQIGWTWLVNWINANSTGYKHPDGSTESMSKTCARSEYIWWYGSSAGKMATQANNTHKVPASNWKPMSVAAKDSFEGYKEWSDLWGKGKVVIICSAVRGDEEIKPFLKFVANNGTFTYDGSPKTVSGLDTEKTLLSQLKPGHNYEVVATRTETEPGAYPVKIVSVKIYEGSKVVNDSYSITTVDGSLIIIDEQIKDDGEANSGGGGLPESDSWRCVNTQSDSATAYAFNTTRGSYGFTPAGSPGLNGTYGDRWTPAGNHARGGAPGVGSSLSSWKSWKATFLAGSDTITPTLNLETAGVSDVLSKYGGVYNISRSLRKDTYNVSHCQPQTRVLERKIGSYSWSSCTTNAKGETNCHTRSSSYIYYEWTPWKNDGERLISSSSGPSSNTEHYNYQLLSVNCNKDGFNSVRNSVGGTVRSLASGDGGAVLQTPERSGAGPGALGRGSHVTATDAFYNDGDSCREAFTCTVDVNPSASNDANNNLGNTDLFTEQFDPVDVKPGMPEYGVPNDNGEAVFFRDNNDRQVRADIWYPRNTGKSDLESYSGAAAKSTFAKIYAYPAPTPELELTKIAPWNSKSDTINSLNSEKKYNGNINRFLMKSQWTSDKGKPYQVGVNWEYNATGKNIVPGTVDGYTVKSMTGINSYDFDVYCEFKNNKGDYQANIPETPFAYGKTSRTWNSHDAVRALFTRSVSDMTK